jgi:phage-related minor tail protein
VAGFKVAEGFVEFVPKIDASKAKRQVKDTVKDANKEAAKESEKGGKESGEKFGKGFKKGTPTSPAKGVVDKLTGGGGLAQGMLSVGKAAGLGLAGAVVGAAAIVGKKLFDAMNLDVANDKLAAQLNLSTGAAEKASQAAASVYANNWGSSIADVNEAIRSVDANLGKVAKLSKAQIESMTTSTLALRDAFGVEVPASANAAGLMIKNGMAKNAEQAFDIITRGFQNGNDRAGDWLDTLNEYSPQFQKLGIDGPHALSLISAAMEAGARNTDIAADLIKEFSIRAVDGSKLTGEGFKAAGLDADKMAAAIGKGGPSAEKAFREVLTAVTSIKDPVKREIAGVALFGTQWEDLGPKAAAAMATAKTGVDGLDGATDKLANTMGDNLASKIESLKRQGEVWANSKLLPFVEQLSARFTSDFLPALESIRSAFAFVVPIAKEFGEKILSTLKDNVAGISDAFRDNKPQLEAFAGALADLAPVVGTILVASMRAAGLAIEYLIRSVGFAVDSFLWLKENIAGVAAGGLEIWKGFVAGVFVAIGMLLESFRKYAHAADIVFGTNTEAALNDAIDGFKVYSQHVSRELQASINKMHRWQEEARSERNLIKLKADVRDIQSKIDATKRRLRDKSLTNPQRSKLRADLSKLQEDLHRAQAKINAIKGKTVGVRLDYGGMTANLRRHLAQPYMGVAGGGLIGMADGGFTGPVRGPGSDTSDMAGLFALSNNEYVIRASAVRKYGVDAMDAINEMKVPQASAALSPMAASAGGGNTIITGPVIVQIPVQTAREFQEMTDLLSAIVQTARTKPFANGRQTGRG